MATDDGLHAHGLSVDAVADGSRVRPDWTPVDRPAIDGVTWHEIRSVVAGDGHLTELWRREWALDPLGVDQVFTRTLTPGAITAWHVHLRTTDRLACPIGDVLVVLYDARIASPTHGAVAEFRIGEHRPVTISVPPGVVHGVASIGTSTALVVNAVDRAYAYDDPDHLRLPVDSPDVPYRFR